ncbi:MAG: hypothetical protein CM15mP74_35700 [Halieaceae bacterium]|nr:MAG: hypothetical protein CM15mP74_35700 [Halieaceae bacterium]
MTTRCCSLNQRFCIPETADVPDEMYTIPFGEANFVVKVMTSPSLPSGNGSQSGGCRSMRWLRGISCDLIDPRTTLRWTRTRFWNPWRPPAD